MTMDEGAIRRVLGPAETALVDPLADLPQGGSRLVTESLDLLVRSSLNVRRASLYVGAVLGLTVGPFILLVMSFVLDGATIDANIRIGFGPSTGLTATAESNLESALFVTQIVAIAGCLVVAIESQAVAIATLAGRLTARPLSLREALVRSRSVFWRLLAGVLLAGIPVFLVQAAVQTALTSGGNTSQGAALVATAAGTLIGIPFVYVGTGIVLGEVRPIEAVFRSFRLVRARPRTAAIVAVFAALSQYLLVFGAGVGGDLVARLASLLDLGSRTPQAVAIAAVIVAALIVAAGTLVFTVAAISVAPQVVAFLALTRYTGGLERARAAAAAQYGPTGPVPGVRRFRWLTRPLVVGVVIAVLALAAGLAQLPAS